MISVSNPAWRFNLKRFFASGFDGPPFRLFSRPHLAVLAVVAALCLGTLLLRGAPAQTRSTLTLVTGLVLLVNEIAWHVWNWRTGRWTLQTLLPLHLCGIMVWSAVYMLLSGDRRLYELMYFMGIGAASQALLTPDLSEHDYPHFRFFQTFISHGLLVVTAVYMTVVEGLRPYPISLLRVGLGMNALLLVIGLVNWRLGSNYFFIARKPDTPSLLDYLGPWPWYILALEAIGLVICLLLYLPFAIMDWR